MATLKPMFQALRTHCGFLNKNRLFSSSTQVFAPVYRKNPVFLRNRFIPLREHVFDNPPKEKVVKSRVSARRKAYIRPKIKPWSNFQEIPYHYREGRNKALLIPEIKKKHIKKYKNQYEERPHYRSRFQRLTNRGRGLIPYDKKIPVLTGKHTGPGVEGGSELAQKLGALHLVQPTGFVNRHGNFKQVKDMIPEFVVPNLEDCQLKPYVSYRATEINQSKFTARNLYNAFYGEDARKKFEEETGLKTNLELKQAVKQPEQKSSSWLPWKKGKS